MKKESKFKVESDSLPAGDQPQAIEILSNSIKDGHRYQTSEGITSNDKTHTMVRDSSTLFRSLLLKCFLFLFLMFNSLFATVNIPTQFDKINHFEVDMFYDASGTMTLDSIQKEHFIPSVSQFTFGHRKGNTWFKLELKNPHKATKIILHFTEPYFQEMHLYTKVGNVWFEEKNGLEVLLEKRSIVHHTPTFELSLDANSMPVYYIKSRSRLTTSGEFEIYNTAYFHSMYGSKNNALYMLYFGLVLMLTFFSLSLFIRFKESIYIYYSAYTLFYILWLASYNGLILYLGVGSFFHSFIMVTPLFIMFLILFSSKFLSLEIHLPKIHQLFNLLAGLFGLLAILIVISFEPWFEVMNALASVAFLVLFTTALYLWKKGLSNNVKAYLIAMTSYMITMSLMSAMANGWISNNDITRYSFLFGSLFEITLFAFVLTNRFYLAQSEKIQIQNTLIDIEKEHSRELEEEVKKRTKELEESRSKLEILASVDPLTKLYNRRYFSDKAKILFHTVLKEKSNLCIIVFDIDNFKQINDTYGHNVGDEVIIALANELHSFSRQSDMAFRFGGDEFMLLLPQTTLETAKIVAKRIQEKLETTRVITKDDIEIEFTISIGISIQDIEHDKTIEDTIDRADKALYQSKKEGRNKISVLS